MTDALFPVQQKLRMNGLKQARGKRAMPSPAAS